MGGQPVRVGGQECHPHERHGDRSTPGEDYEHHPEVKLPAAAHRVCNERLPADLNAKDFRLGGWPRGKFRCVKKRGLPARFRLFYIFSSVERVIIPLYLNDADTLRKRRKLGSPTRSSNACSAAAKAACWYQPQADQVGADGRQESLWQWRTRIQALTARERPRSFVMSPLAS